MDICFDNNIIKKCDEGTKYVVIATYVDTTIESSYVQKDVRDE